MPKGGSGDADDREDIVAFFGDPAAYGPRVDRVEGTATQISPIDCSGDREVVVAAARQDLGLTE
jgi:hypothetical protein